MYIALVFAKKLNILEIKTLFYVVDEQLMLRIDPAVAMINMYFCKRPLYIFENINICYVKNVKC